MVRYLQVGDIVNTHGIRGELKIVSRTDFPEIRFARGSSLLLFPPGDRPPIPVTVSSARPHKGTWLIKLEEFHDINEVEPFKGGKLKVPADQLVELGEHEFYYHEIVGCRVSTEDGAFLGTVSGILATGANDVWVVRSPEGREWLIPYVEAVVKKVDPAAKEITIHPLEGLLD